MLAHRASRQVRVDRGRMALPHWTKLNTSDDQEASCPVYPLLTGNPLVSIVIPTHNRASTVVQAIESARRQDYPNIEIIVVDDGSPVPLELEPSLLANVTVARHAVRRGPAAARNTGMIQARGQLLLFLDDDDRLCLNRISRGVAQLGHAAAHACSVRFVTETGKSWVDPTRYSGDLRRTWHLPTHPAMGQVLHRQEHVLQFDESLRLAEDKEWWIRMAPYACYAWDAEVGLVVTRHRGQRPGVDPKSGFTCRLEVYRRHAHSLDRRSRAHLAALVGNAALNSGDTHSAATWATTSLLLFPTKRGIAVRWAAAYRRLRSRLRS